MKLRIVLAFTLQNLYDRMRIALYTVFVCVVAVSTPGLCAEYPVKPVRVIVPYAPGGGTDVIARALARKMSERASVQHVVDNRAGANGAIGVELAARAPANGYTLVMIANSHAVNVSLQKGLSFDLVHDLTPITEVASTPYFLVVNPSVAARSVKELISLAKARPGQLNYGSSGTGGLGHLAGALFGSITGIEVVHIAYKGGNPAMVDVISGNIQMLFSTLLQANAHIKAGRLRSLAVTAAKRSVSAPEIPTMIESGVPGYEVSQWYGLVAPSKTPRPIIAKIHSEVVFSLREPDVREAFASEGADIIGSTAGEFSQHMRFEIAKWARVVKSIGMSAELSK